MRVPKNGICPMKVWRNKSFRERMIAIFFMKSSLIKSIPLEPGASISAHWYINSCLSQVFDAISKRRGKTGLCELISHDENARLHRAWVRTEVLAKNRIESYSNTSYSSDLSSCVFFLFLILKNQLRNTSFNNDDEILNPLNNVIGSLTKEDFQNSFSD